MSKILRLCDLTEFVGIFSKTYWGATEFPIADDYKEIAVNRDDFIIGYDIYTSFKNKTTYDFINICRDELKLDHVEFYRSTDYEFPIICIFSPYSDVPQKVFEYGFIEVPPLYLKGVKTYLKEFSSIVEVRNMIKKCYPSYHVSEYY